jgi:RNA polymerase sigma-70 factor (ECF subfamily)
VAEDREQRRAVAALLSTLPERYRAAVVLRHIEGLSYVEMADVLDQPAGTIKANVHRGLETLRKTLTEEKSEVKL